MTEIKFYCPNCNSHCAVSKDMIGTVAECPKCGQQFEITKSSFNLHSQITGSADADGRLKNLECYNRRLFMLSVTSLFVSVVSLTASACLVFLLKTSISENLITKELTIIDRKGIKRCHISCGETGPLLAMINRQNEIVVSLSALDSPTDKELSAMHRTHQFEDEATRETFDNTMRALFSPSLTLGSPTDGDYVSLLAGNKNNASLLALSHKSGGGITISSQVGDGRIELLGTDEKRKISLIQTDDVQAMSFRESSGRARAALIATKDSSMFTLTDITKLKGAAIELEILRAGSRMSLIDNRGVPSAKLSSIAGSTLGLYNVTGKKRISLGTIDDTALLGFYDEEGKVIWYAPRSD